MKEHKLHIKNMVCQRCISVVESIANDIGIKHGEVRLGEIDLQGDVPDKKMKAFEASLTKSGFEIINNRANALIDKIKKRVLLYCSELGEEKRGNLSDHISEAMHYDYSYLSNLFSSAEGTTIEQYFILQRIEKAKELLVYGQLSLSEIADSLGYSSVHHLSSQFKKITGLTPSYFKKVGASRRTALDKL